MEDIRAPDKETIRKAYEAGEGTFKKLSEMYEVSEGTIKSWAKQDKDKGQPWVKPTQPKPKNQNKKVEQKVEKKKRVTEDKKEEVLTSAAIGKSKARIAQELGMSQSTVRKVINESDDQLMSYREVKKIEFINKSWDSVTRALEYGNQKITLATVAAESFDDKIEDLIQALKDGEADPRTISDTVKALSTAMNIPLRDIAVYIGTIYDKIALATGGATSNVNVNSNTNSGGSLTPEERRKNR